MSNETISNDTTTETITETTSYLYTIGNRVAGMFGYLVACMILYVMVLIGSICFGWMVNAMQFTTKKVAGTWSVLRTKKAAPVANGAVHESV